MKLKIRFKLVFLWIIIITVLISTSAFAAFSTHTETVSMRNAKSLIDEAATVQAIAHVTEMCINEINGYDRVAAYPNEEWGHNGRTGGYGGIYDKYFVHHQLAMGPYITTKLRSDITSGKAACNAGNMEILYLFSETIGLPIEQVLCNKDNSDYPGLIAHWGGDGEPVDYRCYYWWEDEDATFTYNSEVGTYTVYGQEYSTGREYLRLLYEHYRETSNHPYLPSWYDIWDFHTEDYYRYYYLLLNDFETVCGSSKLREKSQVNNNQMEIKTITDDGVEAKDYYLPPSSDKTFTTIAWQERTCSQLAEDINKYYDGYKDKLEEVYKTECKTAVGKNWYFLKRQAEIILDRNPQPTDVNAHEEWLIGTRVMDRTSLDKIINEAKKDPDSLKQYDDDNEIWQLLSIDWKNYTVDEEGNKVLIEFTEDEQREAQDLLVQFNLLAPTDFVSPEGGVWSCINTDGNIVDVETYQDPTNGLIDNTSGNVEPTCANSGGAESLGWIVCPVLEWMRKAATDVYNNALVPVLQIEPKLFTNSSSGGAEQAWSFFQGLANSLFAAFFLIVVFSQLTGIGIDNYGIKKIMPKLIVAAVLINLSYLICIICVDLSNILGNGLQNLFDSLPTGTPDPSVSSALGSSEGATAITAVILLAGLGGGALVVWKNPAVLISLLVGALGVVIAIFFIFALLSAREAAIVILTVLSPLAFACYMLPNTKKLFDKWLKFGEGLLLIYPICGVLIGGGNFASKLLLSAGIASQGFWSALTAMLVGIIPIFFIPTVLKGAFAAMGTIGSKIAGFGDRMRGGITKGLRNSETYKGLQERGRETGIRRRAGYDRDGNRKWGENGPNRFQRFVRGGRRNIQRNALAYQKLKSEKGSLEATDGSDYMLATETANEVKRIVANGEINDNAKLQSSLYNALMANDRAKIRAYTDVLSGKGEDGRQVVKAAYNRAVGAGLGRTEASRSAAQTFANNILSNHGADYKNNSRSMFETAKNINQTQGRSITDTNTYLSTAENRAQLAGKVTATTIGNMDDDAFGELFGGYNGVTVSIPNGADAKQIGAAAYAALNSQNANINAKRRSYLEKIVKASGYSPEPQNVNVVKNFQTDVRALNDETLLDITTNPNASNNGPNRMAAEIEWRRRNPKG